MLLQYWNPDLNHADFLNRHRTSSSAFTRTRKLPFKTLCLFLLNLVKGSLQDELDAFFQVLNGSEFEERFITKSALSQARQYLNHTAFVELSDHFLDQYYKHIEIKKWRGYRLCAIDGSSARLPDNEVLQTHFGGQKNGTVRCTQARLSECYDVLNHMTLDLQVMPYASAERDLAAIHLSKTSQMDLMLYDRGYPAFWFFALHRHHGREFCMRVPVSLFPETAKFNYSRSKDKIVTLNANKDAIAKCGQLGIEYHPIKLRLIKVVLSTGEIEILITTLLDKTTFPHNLFIDLYFQRWGIEEDYKRQKSRLEIENFSGLTVHAVMQDIFAKTFMKNITMAAVALAQPSVEKKYKSRKYAYQINITQAISRMKHFVIKLTVSLHPKTLFQNLIDLLIDIVEPIRQGRSNPRKENSSIKKRFHINYKRTR